MRELLLFCVLFAFLRMCNSNRSKDWKMFLAGGLAGGVSNAIIYPLDTMKTLLQTDLKLKSSQEAFQVLLDKGIQRIYGGMIPAVVGSIPSSALYFGTYETVKDILSTHCNKIISRPVRYMIAASSGNIMSSLIFVPKEVIKQQVQAFKSGSLPWNLNSKINSFEVSKMILQRSGIRGFYVAYRATLARNIPSAMVSMNYVYLF
jgi:hypothetical protein